MTMMLERSRRRATSPQVADRGERAVVATRPRKPLESELARVLRARGLPADGLPRCGVTDESFGEEAVAAVRNASETDDQLPHAGAATIVCDGSGGYRVSLGDWAGAECGTEGCVTRHEQSHIADWQKRWPKGCEGNDDGTSVPTGGPGYADFLKKSECDAHTVDLTCAENLKKSATGDCKAKVEEYRKLTAEQKANFC